MRRDWRNAEWGDLATLEYGKGLRNYEGRNKPYRVYGTNGPIGTHDSSLTDGPTVVVGRKGAYRGIHYSEAPCYVIDTAFYLKPRSRLNMRWAYYALLTQDINGMDSGSAIPSTSRDAFYRLHVRVPSLPEQGAIASVLGAFDDKIALNRKMTATLEAMARALFKSWFVDFDPVRAKVDGRDTGLSPEIAALFPESLQESVLGEIPASWHISSVESICSSISSGGTPPRMNSEYWENGNIAWFKTGELKDSPLLDSSEHITDVAIKNSACKLWPPGTVLFALYASPTVGRMGLLTKAGTSNQAAAGLIADTRYGTPFLFQTLFFARQGIQHIAVGAAQQNINLSVLKAHKIISPPHELARCYSTLMTPLVDRQIKIVEESALLSSLRDTLLPKLVSGELRVA